MPRYDLERTHGPILRTGPHSLNKLFCLAHPDDTARSILPQPSRMLEQVDGGAGRAVDGHFPAKPQRIGICGHAAASGSSLWSRAASDDRFNIPAMFRPVPVPSESGAAPWKGAAAPEFSPGIASGCRPTQHHRSRASRTRWCCWLCGGL
jgi:hypothetical protein